MMDSEESQHDSSSSSASSDSSDNSRQSSPERDNDNDNEPRKSPTPNLIPTPTRSPKEGSADRHSRLRSASSDSESSFSSSSAAHANDRKSPISGADPEVSNDTSSRSESVEKQKSVSPRNLSASPIAVNCSSRNSKNSRNSSSSSGRSRSHSQSRSRSRSRSRSSNSRENHVGDGDINISHEDLSDVTDDSEKRMFSINNSKQSVEDEGTNASSIAADNHKEKDDDSVVIERRYSIEIGDSSDAVITDLRQKLDKKKCNQQQQQKTKENGDEISGGFESGEIHIENGNLHADLEDFVKTHEDEILDFEAEEGECTDVKKNDEEKENSDGEAEDGEELEEGEVTDEDEKRPEETEPKPVCRFYTRGQCTWGMSCRFLHPGVTDKGNYTMFDLIRPVMQTGAGANARSHNFTPHTSDYHDYRNERPPIQQRALVSHPVPVYPPHQDPRAHPEAPVVESAWERGLRTAKEMMRKANKRKEQDIDFEDKKMNLTLSQEELDKDAYYFKDRGATPEAMAMYRGHSNAGGMYPEPAASVYTPPERFQRGIPVPVYDEIDPYGRTTRYRELPAHRMPQYEDDRRVRPTREVIVQRVEPVGRGDEWNDPWMRAKSPGGPNAVPRDRNDKRRRDRRSYSSNSSYSSTTSSQSDSSSNSSHSPSPTHKRRYNSGSYKTSPRRHSARPGRSPTSLPRRSRRSPTALHEQKNELREPKAHLFSDHDRSHVGGPRHSPSAKRRGHALTPIPTEKRSTFSPPHKRKKVLASSKKPNLEKLKTKRRHESSTSASGSSESSASESESETGSSSSESSHERTPPTKRTRLPEKAAITEKRPVVVKKATEPPKKRSPISIEIKKQPTVGTSALLSPTGSVGSDKNDVKKSRREELLKQLRAVEDAIAKKRSKLA